MTAAALLIECLLAACSGVRHSSNGPREIAAAPPSTPQTRSTGDAGVIYVARRKWHIDVGFAAADLRAPLDVLTARFPGAKYLFFGFGDRHYLLAKSHDGPAMLGALWPGPGMLLVTALKNTPAEAFGASSVIELDVSSADALAAQAFIGGSFAPGGGAGGEPPAPYGPGPYDGSLYFGAVQRYSAFHTCNTWAAEALKAAHVPVDTRMVLFAGQLWRDLNRKAADCRSRKPPSSASPGVPPPSSSAEATGCCC